MIAGIVVVRHATLQLATWSSLDRHIVAILRALNADLEDGSPAGPLYSQSPSVALAHYLKESTGISPYQYSLRCRIDRAKEFLRSPQFTVRQVAEATGFADQSHFTKVCHRVVGVTPLQFRANRPTIIFSCQLRTESA